MRIVLIGNYSKDKQESMNRFAQALYTGYNDAGIDVEIWSPEIIFAKFAKSSNAGIGKWLAYIDKLVAFPVKLRLKQLNKQYKSGNVRFHICDHSNSFYLKSLPQHRTVITCHDVLAIRGAFGYEDAYCPASTSGKIFQKIILKNLSKAKRLAAVSQFTLNQLQDLLPGRINTNDKWEVIHNGFNSNFWKMDACQSAPLLKNAGISVDEKYILHVGSDLTRKNRKMLLDMVHSLGEKYDGKICFAGQAIDKELLSHADALGLRDKLVSVLQPDHLTLVALYSNCETFIFPSFSEGFGWPVIEAQACGAPVITSDLEPFIEVGGNGVLFANPNDPDDFAAAYLKLADPVYKADLVKQGYDNCSRFSANKMVNSYLALHLSES